MGYKTPYTPQYILYYIFFYIRNYNLHKKLNRATLGVMVWLWIEFLMKLNKFDKHDYFDILN